MHEPLRQTSDPEQPWQTPPPVPQAPFVPPLWQTPFVSRQPAQVPPVQTPLATSQVAPPVAQLRQVMPDFPHAVLLSEVSQVPSLFVQPWQLGFEQRLPAQVWLVLQVAQTEPPLPHAAALLPERQAPVASQQPAQVWAQVLPPPPPAPPPTPPTFMQTPNAQP
jgi:hypothetical protein